MAPVDNLKNEEELSSSRDEVTLSTTTNEDNNRVASPEERETSENHAEQGDNDSSLNHVTSPEEGTKEEREKMLKTPDNVEELEGMASATVVVPPDGGWGWVVVAASFVCNFVVDGIIFSFGLFLNDISSTFTEPKSVVSIAGSLLSGFYLIAGPFVSALANRYGFRLVTIAGAIVSSAAFAISSLANSVGFLFISYGIIGGIGFGMIYSPSIITVGYYFEKWRALATGIAVCGSGIGTFLIAPLCQTLIVTIGWRGAMLVQAGFALLCVICGAMFRPLKPVRVAVERDPNEPDTTENNLLQKIKIARDADFKNSTSVTSLKDMISDLNQLTRTSKSNVDYPTIADVLLPERPDSADTQTSKLSKSSQSLENTTDVQRNINKRLSVPLLTNKDILADEHDPVTRKESSSTLFDKRSDRRRGRTVSESSSTAGRSRRGTVTDCVIRSRRGTITQLEAGVNRPLYRDDIFFGSSLSRLHKYQSERDFLGYTISVTRLPTKQDEKEEGECRICPEAVRRTMATMLDVSLLKSPTFLLLSLSGFLTLMGFFTPFMYLTDRATVGGMDENTAKWLISAIGITNTIGRVLCGALSTAPGVNALVINNIALTVGGIATMFSGLSNSTTFLFSYSAIFGFAIACFASLRSILLVDLLGLEKLSNAFGLLLLFQGIAAAVGAPIAGMFMEYTQGYEASFYLSGTLLLVSGVLCYPLNAINKWEKRKLAEKNEETKTPTMV